MIIALAGRRIDSPDSARPVFPVANVDFVREQLLHLFREKHVGLLVCSAACGADLIALEAAEVLGVRRRIILPFAPARFRETSVVDRPGSWGPLFDRIIAEAEAANDLIDLHLELDSAAYVHTNHVILSEAVTLAEATRDRPAAVMVWNGIHAGEDDMTGLFGDAARVLGLEVWRLSTL